MRRGEKSVGDVGGYWGAEEDLESCEEGDREGC